MKPGDLIGHEMMGEAVETGRGVTKLRKGDRIWFRPRTESSDIQPDHLDSRR